MTINTLPEKFTVFLGSLYDAEQRFLSAQMQMQAEATESTLKEGLQTHIQESRLKIANLEEAFRLLGTEPPLLTSHAANGLVQEAQEYINASATNRLVLDTVIADAQFKTEHHEISCYRALLVGARELGKQEIVDLLQQNLQFDEKNAQMLEQLIPQLAQAAAQQPIEV
jgi:ferritin-like metal-binding protein YciE